mgnify:FL=1
MNVIMRGLDRIAQKAIENQDRIIDRSPISQDIEIYHVTNSNDLFGYEAETTATAIRSKAIIKFNPERSFLKANGVFFEEGSDIPIIMFAKYTDNIQKLDRIKLVMHDKISEFTENFQVVNIKTKGGFFTHNKFYLLAPWRG